MKAVRLLALALLCGVGLAGCASRGMPEPVTAPDTQAVPTAGVEVQRGRASWYGDKFHGRRTASGERFDMHDLTAAHPTLPFGTRLLVRNVDNGREVTVRINDRGPSARGRIIDLSRAAAAAIGLVQAGTGNVVLLRP